MVSKYWYEKGIFFEVARNKYLFQKNDIEFDFKKYLHGFCDVFIIKLFELAKKHNVEYPIAVILTNEGLVHAFCWVESPVDGVDYFIDVRGITSSKENFFNEFKDLFDYQYYFSDMYDETNDEDCDIYGHIEFFYSLEEYLNFAINYFDDEDYFKQEDILEESLLILDTFKENYLLPEWIIEDLMEW